MSYDCLVTHMQHALRLFYVAQQKAKKEQQQQEQRKTIVGGRISHISCVAGK